MALIAYIAVAVVAVIAVIVVKLLRQTDSTSTFSVKTKCPVCGRPKGLLKCPYCSSDSERPPRWGR